MLAAFNGRVRTLREFAVLIQESGWEIAGVKRAPGGLWAYVTAVPA